MGRGPEGFQKGEGRRNRSRASQGMPYRLPKCGSGAFAPPVGMQKAPFVTERRRHGLTPENRDLNSPKSRAFAVDHRALMDALGFPTAVLLIPVNRLIQDHFLKGGR